MQGLIQYFLERKFLVKVLSLVFIVSGLVVATGLIRDLIPPMAFKGASIRVTLPGASALQIESLVIAPIEQSLRGLADLKEINSESSASSGSIRMSFSDRISHNTVDKRIEEIRARLQTLRVQLPEKLEEIQVFPWKNTDVWFASVALLGTDPWNQEQRQTVLKIQEEFTRLQGVSRVVHNLPENYLSINFDLEKLRYYGFHIRDLVPLIREKITPLTVAQLRVQGQNIGISLPDPLSAIDELQQIVVRRPRAGPAIALGDLAQIQMEQQPQEKFQYLNAQPYVRLTIFKDYKTDIFHLSQALDKKVEQLNSEISSELKLLVHAQGSSMIGKQIDVLKVNAMVGLFLILTLLGYFLGPRVALMTTLGILISYMVSLVVMRLTGINVNLISIVAMILVIGLLVDDAIVVSEKYTDFLRAGDSPKLAALRASTRMLAPVSAGIITTMIAFSPILLLGGWLTEVFMSIPVVVISSLAVSWFEAFFILPRHLYDFVPQPSRQRNVLKNLSFRYETLLRNVLRFRFLSLTVILALVVSTLWIYQKKIKSDFNMSIGPREVSLVATLKDKPSLSEAEEMFSQLVRDLLEKVDGASVKHTYLDIGQAWIAGQQQTGPRFAELYLSIDDQVSDPAKAEERLKAQIEEFIESYDVEKFERISVSTQFGSEQEEQKNENVFDLYFQGSTAFSYADVAQKSEPILESIPGFLELSYEMGDQGVSWDFVPNENALYDYGISQSEVSSQLRHLLYRENIGHFYADGEMIKVDARFANYNFDDTADIEFLANIKILGPQSQLIPISRLGSWKKQEVQNTWRRRQLERTLSFKVKFDPEKTRSEDFTKNLNEASKKLEVLFPTYTVASTPANRMSEENKRWMLEAVLMALAGIFFIISLQLQSFVRPLIVCSAILFGFIGATWATYLHGFRFDLMAMVGLLGVAGVSVNVSLLLVDCIGKRGDLNINNIIGGARERFAPIMLSTLTTLGGLFPMAYGIGGDAGFTRSLAFSMAWGIFASTLLTLFGVPVLLSIGPKVHSLKGKIVKAPTFVYQKYLIRRKVEHNPSETLNN